MACLFVFFFYFALLSPLLFSELGVRHLFLAFISWFQLSCEGLVSDEL